MRIQVAVILGAGFAVLSACSEAPQTEKGVQAPDVARNQGEVVAYVNDQPIAAERVEHLALRLGMAEAVERSDQAALGRISESLINSRAMAVLAEADLDEAERKKLALDVASYREELLVKRYLKDTIEPKPVGSDEVLDYYQKHPEAFGGGVEKTFEILRAGPDISDDERNGIIRALGSAAGTTDWKKWAQELGGQVAYRKSTARPAVLDGPLKALVEKTNAGSVSPVNTSEGILVVRVLDEHTVPPQPLEAVASRIRKMLAPMHLKEAVKAAAGEARKKVSIRKPN